MGRAQMGKSELQPKNPRELQEIQVWLVARVGRVEKQLLVQEMMVLHKGQWSLHCILPFDKL